jgi:hypothetical protein
VVLPVVSAALVDLPVASVVLADPVLADPVVLVDLVALAAPAQVDLVAQVLADPVDPAVLAPAPAVLAPAAQAVLDPVARVVPVDPAALAPAALVVPAAQAAPAPAAPHPVAQDQATYRRQPGRPLPNATSVVVEAAPAVALPACLSRKPRTSKVPSTNLCVTWVATR